MHAGLIIPKHPPVFTVRRAWAGGAGAC